MAAEQLSKEQLKELARSVVVAQGNGFIKELLRNVGGKIGTTKEAFATNLEAAIWTCTGFAPVTHLIMPPWLRMRAD